MTSSSSLRTRLGLSGLCLLPFLFLPAAARAQGPAASPSLEDALRNPALAHFYEQFAAGLGSAEWARFTLEVLLEREGMAEAVEDFDALADACRRRHLSENPGPEGEAMLNSEAGRDWLGECALDPDVPAESVERLARVQVASSEIGLAGVILLREGAGGVLARSGDLPAAAVDGLAEWLRGRITDLADFARCAAKATATKVGPAETAALSDLYSQTFDTEISACRLAGPRPLPAALAAETRLPFDAYGRVIHLLAVFEQAFPESEQWLATAAAVTKTTSPASWRQAQFMEELNLLCSREFRARNPRKTAQEYEGFLASPAGNAFVVSCVDRLLADGERGAARTEGVVAMLEVGATLVKMISVLPLLAEEMGLDAAEIEEVPEELSARALRHARLWVPFHACLAREIYAALGVEVVRNVTRPADLDPALQARIAAVVEKKTCVPADGTFDPTGAVFDPESAALATYAKRFGSAAWARLLLHLVVGQDPELQALLAAESRIGMRCGITHRRQHAELGQGDYQALLRSDAGRQALLGCFAGAAEDPDRGEGDRQALLAASATRLTLASLFATAKQLAGADFSAMTPKLSGEELERLVAEAARLKESHRCAVGQVAKTTPLIDIITGQPAAKSAIEAAGESADCSPGAAGPG
jgi:hypothetical protein